VRDIWVFLASWRTGGEIEAFPGRADPALGIVDYVLAALSFRTGTQVSRLIDTRRPAVG